MCLARKDSANLTGMRGNQRSFGNGQNSTSSTSRPEDCIDVRGSQCSWSGRNGSPSPWLQRYKIKKRATTSYVLQNPTQNCNEEGIESHARNQHEYVNLSHAVIWDAF
jgi:hypothetical protein